MMQGRIIFCETIREIVFTWFPIYVEMTFFDTVPYPVKSILIFCDSLCFILMFVTLIAAHLLVETEFSVCGCPIFIKIDGEYSLLWQFLNCAPVSAYNADSSTFSIF